MQIISLAQMLYMSGVYDSDGDLEKDMKIANWIGKRKFMIVDSLKEVDSLSECADQKLDLLIIKEN